MQRFVRTGAALVLALAMLGTAAQAAHLQNKSDAWAWITVYEHAGRSILKSFCLAPGASTDIGDFRTMIINPPAPPVPATARPYELRAEVTHKGCSHPVMLDRTLGFDGTTPYYVIGANGNYAFRHTP
jgi:hypothetical protein